MSSGDTTSYEWISAGLVTIDEAPNGPMFVADSWRSSSGRVAAFGAHRRRFEGSVANLLGGNWSRGDWSGGDWSGTDWGSFWSEVTAAVQHAHRASGNPELFPRVSLRSRKSTANSRGSNVAATAANPARCREGAAPSSFSTRHLNEVRLILEVRPAPPIRPVTRLLYTPVPDPRRSPWIKGPDLARLSAARERAVPRGYDDLVLCASDGAVLETCTGNLMWWDGGVAVFPERQDSVLPGVTAQQVRLRLEETGVPLRFANVAPPELAGHAVWFLNSLHGISPVSELSDRGASVPLDRHPHEAKWRQWWLALPGVEFDAG